MKKIVTATSKFGPYNSIEVLEDRYHVDGADLPFTVIGQGEISDVVDGDFPVVVTRPPYDETAAEVRKQRDIKLAESDWTQLTDAPINSALWAVYRQALRDVPLQSGFPWEVNWPQKL